MKEFFHSDTFRWVCAEAKLELWLTDKAFADGIIWWEEYGKETEAIISKRRDKIFELLTLHTAKQEIMCTPEVPDFSGELAMA